MAKIAILGFGTIGSGVLDVTRANPEKIARRAGEPVEVKYVVDIRDFSDHPDANLFLKDIGPVLADPEVKVCVETIGGTRFAYPMVKAALESGRSVCTSNKELVATHGAELLAIAREKGGAFLFEASVGGGMPLIAPMHRSLSANEIESVLGIVNGTTNFMLTKMVTENMGFDEALKLAQSLGYAETKDPGDDVDGRDAARKIAILANISYGKEVHVANVPARGIRDITVQDVKAAAALGCAIKLIASCSKGEKGQVYASVQPMLVPGTNMLSKVDDVFNAVLIRGNMTGDVMFYGKGAGKLPTASAVVADVCDALRGGCRNNDSLFWTPTPDEGKPLQDPAPYACYLRVQGLDKAAVAQMCGAGKVVSEGEEGIGYLADSLTPEQIAAAEAAAAQKGGKVALVLRKLPC